MDIVLLGGSNSVLKNGLKNGLGKGALANYSLGNSTSLQNLYELIRHEKDIQNAKLIVSESNVNDILSLQNSNAKPDIIHNNIALFYETLSCFSQKVIVLILPLANSQKYEFVNEWHRKNISKYGFNFIDLDKYFTQNRLKDFYAPFGSHPLPKAMELLGKNILAQIQNLSNHIKNEGSNKFKVLKPLDSTKPLKLIKKENSAFCEEAFRLVDSICLQKDFKGYKLLGIHSWNEEEKGVASFKEQYSNLNLSNKDKSLNLKIQTLNCFYDLNEDFIVDEQSLISTFKQKAKNECELDYTDIISLFLFKKGEFSLKTAQKAYDCGFLIPPFELYKELIEEYEQTKAFLAELELNKLKAFIQENGLTQAYLTQNKPCGALNLVKRELNYILGQLIIKYSKKSWQKLFLPFILFAAKRRHKESKITNIYAFSDFAPALRARNHLAYKLGTAYLKACKKPLGCFSLPKKLKQIAKEHKPLI